MIKYLNQMKRYTFYIIKFYTTRLNYNLTLFLLKYQIPIKNWDFVDN